VEEAWRRKFVRSVGAKRRSVKKWTNWGEVAPVNLSLYQPGGAYYEEQPLMEPMAVAFLEEFATEEEDRAAYARAREEGIAPPICKYVFTGRELFPGEGSSSGGGGTAGGGGVPTVVEHLGFGDVEEATAVAKAIAESKAELETKEEEEERQEEARAIAEVEAFNAREAEQSRTLAWVIILE
jgi:hypothetical protein